MNHAFLLHSPTPNLFLFDLRQDLNDHHLDYLNYMLDSVIFSSRVNHAHTDTHTSMHNAAVSRSHCLCMRHEACIRPTPTNSWVLALWGQFLLLTSNNQHHLFWKSKTGVLFHLLFYFKCQKQASMLQHLDTIKYLLQCPKKTVPAFRSVELHSALWQYHP